MVWILVPSSQTRSPVWNTWDGILGLVCFMISEATSRAAVTSDRTWFMVRNRSSTVGMVVVNLAGGLNLGRYLYQTSNGDFPVALWARALWANSMNGSRSAQLSTWKLQNTWRYCSNSWLTHSVSPSVCRWNTVDREDLTPSFSHISHITFDANWGPLSDITFLGRPVRFHTWLMYNCNVSSAVIVLLHGANITALLRQSTTTSKAGVTRNQHPLGKQNVGLPRSSNSSSTTQIYRLLINRICRVSL